MQQNVQNYVRVTSTIGDRQRSNCSPMEYDHEIRRLFIYLFNIQNYKYKLFDDDQQR